MDAAARGICDSRPKAALSHCGDKSPSATASAGTILALMAAPCGYRWSDSGGGFRRRNPPPVRFGGGLETLFRLLVSPLAGSGNRRLSRSRSNRRRRHRGSNSLSGDGRNHTEEKIARARKAAKRIFVKASEEFPERKGPGLNELTEANLCCQVKYAAVPATLRSSAGL